MNALLKQPGMLPEEIIPTTAKPIRLTHVSNAPSPGVEAELHFLDNKRTPEPVEQRRALNEIGRIEHLKENSADKDLASQIDEIVVYIDAEILNLFDLVDLPGPGAMGGQDEDAAARQKMLAADLILWVYHEEITGEFERVYLSELAANDRRVLPVVNVWFDPAGNCGNEEILGRMRQDALEGSKEDLQILNTEHSQHFISGVKPVCFWAKAVSAAFQAEGASRDAEILADYGWVDLFDAIRDQVDTSAQNRNRLRKIYASADRILDGLSKGIGRLDGRLADRLTEFTSDKQQLADLLNDALDLRRSLNAELRGRAGDWAAEVQEKVRKLVHAFIESEISYGGLVITLGKKATKPLTMDIEKYLSEKFEKHAHLHPPETCWIAESIRQELDESIDLMQARWSRFSNQFEEILPNAELKGRLIDIRGMVESLAGGVTKVIIEIVLLVVAIQIFGPVGDIVAITFFAMMQLVRDPFKEKREISKALAEGGLIELRMNIKGRLMVALKKANTESYESVRASLDGAGLEANISVVKTLLADVHDATDRIASMREDLRSAV